jgi:hypothetical protein
MSDFKIDMEIKQLIKMGVPDDMAFVIAHINNGKADEVEHVLDKYKQEQQMIKEQLSNFVPLAEVISAGLLQGQPLDVPLEKNLSLYNIDSNAEEKNSNI